TRRARWWIKTFSFFSSLLLFCNRQSRFILYQPNIHPEPDSRTGQHRPLLPEGSCFLPSFPEARLQGSEEYRFRKVLPEADGIYLCLQLQFVPSSDLPGTAHSL